MKRFTVQSKTAGTALLMLAALPLFAQSPAALVQPPNVLTLPAIAPASTPTTANPPPLSASALPALNLPTVTPHDVADAPSVAPPQRELPAITVVPQDSDGKILANNGSSQQPTEEKIYSYGDSNFSILFLSDQVNRMKEAIRSFEDTGKDAEKPAPIVDVIAAPGAPEVIEDPLTYPVFYLASIAFDDAKDWSLWLSGYKITSRRNYTDVTVLNITRDSATFLWKPSFMKAMTKREKEKLFAPIDLVKHKLVPSQAVTIDPAAGTVVFTLKPNQSFAPGYFKTFEGYIDGPTLTALPVVVATSANVGQPLTNQPASQAFDVNGVNGSLIDNGQNFNNDSSFTPPSKNFRPPARQ